MGEFRRDHGIDESLLPGFSAALLAVSEDAEAAKEQDEPVLASALVGDVVAAGASDLHLDPRQEGVALRLRVDGRLREAALLPPELGRGLTVQLRTLVQLDPVAAFAPEESRHSLRLEDRALDLRLVAAPCVAGEKISLRVLDPRQLVPGLDELGMREGERAALRAWLRTRAGMLVVTGPTGSGKTTTLYALLHALRDSERSVVTLEDPVEYRVDGVAQLQVDEPHGLSFERGLRTLLRMDPDTLLVGEIRDAESAATAVRAAVTGHAIMTTLHTRDAVGAVTALRGRGLRDHEIAESLALAVGQRLVRVLCPDCRRQGAPHQREARWLEELGRPVPETSWHAAGCDACLGEGYRGRSGIFEVWRLEGEDLERILAGRDEWTLRERARRAGLVPLLDRALEAAACGTTSLDELRFVSGLVA